MLFRSAWPPVRSVGDSPSTTKRRSCRRRSFSGCVDLDGPNFGVTSTSREAGDSEVPCGPRCRPDCLACRRPSWETPWRSIRRRRMRELSRSRCCIAYVVQQRFHASSLPTKRLRSSFWRRGSASCDARSAGFTRPRCCSVSVGWRSHSPRSPGRCTRAMSRAPRSRSEAGCGWGTAGSWVRSSSPTVGQWRRGGCRKGASLWRHGLPADALLSTSSHHPGDAQHPATEQEQGGRLGRRNA